MGAPVKSFLNYINSFTLYETKVQKKAAVQTFMFPSMVKIATSVAHRVNHAGP